MENPLVKALIHVLSSTPDSSELEATNPDARARQVIQTAALRAAAISGSCAAVSGPLSLLTVVGDLVAVWKVQSQMVSDLAHVYGKQAQLRKEVMLYCLFRHGGTALLRDVATRTGQHLLLKKGALMAFEGALKRVGLNVTQKVIGKGLTRWVPVVGAAGMAGYAYWDTRKVGETAMVTFANEILLEAVEVHPNPLLTDLGVKQLDSSNPQPAGSDSRV